MNDFSDERSPALERLFAAANRELADEAFVAGVMARTAKLNARNLVVVLAVCVVAAPVAWLVAEPLNDAFLWCAQFLTQPIARTGDGIASAVLPMNTVGGALALSLARRARDHAQAVLRGQLMYAVEAAFLLITAAWLVVTNTTRATRGTSFKLFIAGLGLAALAFALGQARIHMVPAAVVFIVLSLFLLRRGYSHVAVRAVGVVLGSFVVAVSVLLALALPVVTLPAPDGPHAVGVTSFTLVDRSRDDALFGAPGRPREIYVQVWYPSETPKSGPAPRASRAVARAVSAAGARRDLRVPRRHEDALLPRPPAVAGPGVLPCDRVQPVRGRHCGAEHAADGASREPRLHRVRRDASPLRSIHHLFRRQRRSVEQQSHGSDVAAGRRRFGRDHGARGARRQPDRASSCTARIFRARHAAHRLHGDLGSGSKALARCDHDGERRAGRAGRRVRACGPDPDRASGNVAPAAAPSPRCARKIRDAAPP